ncbi:hypothetical protein AVEN_33695-1 [Araneus ventricosus]|uniref:Uncharacterized protein n=1 Tax=Araneus ventricosus TaxID=182803 RepID=A0A4Y2R8B3_ARAVE|nr:hypothetical protein AVEN_33695-1 [Araneus ventricosus]
MKIPVVDSKGDPNCCYTIDSFVGKPNTEEDLYPNTFTIELDISTQVEEYVMSSVPVMIQVKVHDRRAMVNPFSDGYSLKGGMQYNAYVSMQTQELLPSPYDTHCLDYLEIWKRNNGTGPLSHKMCVEYCQLNKLLEMGKCIDRNVDYPHEFQLRTKNNPSQKFDSFDYSLSSPQTCQRENVLGARSAAIHCPRQLIANNRTHHFESHLLRSMTLPEIIQPFGSKTITTFTHQIAKNA